MSDVSIPVSPGTFRAPSPKPTLIGISGLSGSGKDTIADELVKSHGYTKVALADPMKRFCAEVFEFSDEQLWGASNHRNIRDMRYPRTERAKEFGHCLYAEECSPEDFLTPRMALQLLGTEWGRHCYSDVWINYALRVAKALTTSGMRYTSEAGLYKHSLGLPCPVVIPDVRFENEACAIVEAGGVLWKVVGRRNATTDTSHASEVLDIPSTMFRLTIENTGKLDAVPGMVKMAFEEALENYTNLVIGPDRKGGSFSLSENPLLSHARRSFQRALDIVRIVLASKHVLVRECFDSEPLDLALRMKWVHIMNEMYVLPLVAVLPDMPDLPERP